MVSDANGAIHASSAAYRNKFSGKYEYRLITGGVGHDLPREATQAFAKTVIDVFLTRYRLCGLTHSVRRAGTKGRERNQWLKNLDGGTV